MTPIFDMAFKIGNQIPIFWAFLGNGLFNCVNTLNASILISIILFKNANSGPNGNATTNSVIKPYWITKKKFFKFWDE